MCIWKSVVEKTLELKQIFVCRKRVYAPKLSVNEWINVFFFNFCNFYYYCSCCFRYFWDVAYFIFVFCFFFSFYRLHFYYNNCRYYYCWDVIIIDVTLVLHHKNIEHPFWKISNNSLSYRHDTHSILIYFI